MRWEWPLLHRPPVPVHLLAPGPLPSLLANAVLWGVLAVEIGAFGGLLWQAAQHGAWGLAGAAGALYLGVFLLQAGWPRSCAEPLRDHALLLGGLALLWSVQLGLVVPLGLGAVGGALAMALGGLVIYLLWGQRPAFVQMRRRTFRILGDNPDAVAAICRVWLDERGVVVRVKRTAKGPITLAVNRPNMKVVDKVEWRELRGPLEERGEVRVFVGTEPAPEGLEVDFQIQQAPGRHMVSVRHYRMFDRDTLPTIARGPKR